jgi:tetratricopeptide (TPR) repeat protein
MPRPLSKLVADSALTYDGSGEPRWALRRDVRRRALRDMDAEDIARALGANPDRVRDPLQSILERYLTGAPPVLSSLSGKELTALATVSDWLAGLKLSAPDPAEIAALAQLDQLLEPFRRLVRGFHGRTQELETLRDYVGALEPTRVAQRVARGVREVLGFVEKSPLLVFGLGGVGKSTLIARFLLDHQEMPFAYLDFDRAQLDPREPITLLGEILWQLSAQFPRQRSRCLELRTRALELAAQGVEAPAGASSPYALESAATTASERYIVIRDIAAVLEQEVQPQQPFLLVLDSFEEVQYTAGFFLAQLWSLLDDLRRESPRLRVVIAGRAEIDRLTVTPLELRAFDDDAAAAFLIAFGVPDPVLANLVARQVGGNPMSLKLAAAVLSREQASAKGVADLITRRALLFSVRTEQVQAQLYRRILGHIHDDDVRKLAHPGLVLRAITADIIRDVLAGPCGVSVPTDERAKELLDTLEREVSLVTAVEEDGQRRLHHRPDLRRVMLEMLREEQPAKAHDIGRAAAVFHASRDTVFDRAEEIYHRLCLGEPIALAAARWVPGVEARLRSAIDEVPANERPELASRVGVDLDERSRETASLEAWERDTQKQLRELVRIGEGPALEQGLALLRQREERTLASPLLGLEALVLERLDRRDKARRVATLAIKEYHRAGAAGELEARLVLARVEERDGQLDQALACLDAAVRQARDEGRVAEEVEALLSGARVRRLSGAAEAAMREAAAALSNALRRVPDDELHRRPRTYQLAASEARSVAPDVAARVLELLGAPLEPRSPAHRASSPLVRQGVLQAMGATLREPVDLEGFVADALGARLAAIVAASSMSTMIYEIVVWADTQGMVGSLVDVLASRYPKDRAVRALLREVEDEIEE